MAPGAPLVAHRDESAKPKRTVLLATAPPAIVAGGERPVPLTYSYAMTPIHETIEALLEADRAPTYVVHPTQALALERAQALMSLNVCTRAEKDAIAKGMEVKAVEFVKKGAEIYSKA